MPRCGDLAIFVTTTDCFTPCACARGNTLFRNVLQRMCARYQRLTTTYLSMANLFDLCVEVILQSPNLCEKGVLHLPLRISQYLLREACHRKNFVAVEKLVEVWPHPTISFDFLSFPLCRQRQESSESCLLAPEYFDVGSSNELDPCVTSIAVGVFRKVQRQIYQKSTSCNQLRVVDTSRICAAVDNGEYSYLQALPPHLLIPTQRRTKPGMQLHLGRSYAPYIM